MLTNELKAVHLVAFDIPYPANYGGVIDIFHKIRWFHKKGIQVHLHTFEYHRKPSAELEKICTTVYYYQRNMNPFLLFHPQPFISVSRFNKSLLKRLIADDIPVILEGLHTAIYIPELVKHGKKCIVRTHNIEHEYYYKLGWSEKRLFKKWYLQIESFKLKKFEKILQQVNNIACISPADTIYFRKKYGKGMWIPPFHSFDQLLTIKGFGKYILYHGNLDVAENNEAAIFLVKNVFSKLSLDCIIAGNKASAELKQEVEKFPNISLIDHPEDEVLQQLIVNAHVHVLPTFQATGIKIKLITALFSGRFVVVNTPMVDQTELQSVCFVKDRPEEMIESINELMTREFDDKRIEERINKLQQYSNEVSIDVFISMTLKGQ
jgi:hypothetical protein